MRQSKYAALTQYLVGRQENRCILPFETIENIIGCALPQAAHNYAPVFWSNSNQHYALIWLQAGWVNVGHDLHEQTATFRRAPEKAQKYLARCGRGLLTEQQLAPRLALTAQATPHLRCSELVRKADAAFELARSDNQARSLAWEHCYAFFAAAKGRPDSRTLETMSLHLAWYLISSGLLRGSASLLQQDYLIHLPVVQLLLSPDYANLYHLPVRELNRAETIDHIFALAEEIVKRYQAQTKSVAPAVSQATADALVTAILSATLGCVPAYGRYFKQGLAHSNVASNQFTRQSLQQLATYYLENESELEAFRRRLSAGRVEYPPMKVLDICFWQAGFDRKKSLPELRYRL